VLNLRHPGEQVRRDVAHRLGGKVAAGKDVDDVGGLVPALGKSHVDNSGGSLQLQVGDEMRPELERLNFDVLRVFSAGQGELDEIL